MGNSKSDTVNCLAALHSRELVPDQQMKLFCEIVQFRTNRKEGYLDGKSRAKYWERVGPLYEDLSFPLSRPKLFTKLILPKQSEYTHLCDLHHGLNADFVHQWFKLTALEVGAHLELLRATDEGTVGSYAWIRCIKSLTNLHKMWETPQHIYEAFGDFLEDKSGKSAGFLDSQLQQDRCEACILARIGGHPETVLMLRAVVKSRLTPESQARHKSRLRLLRLTDNWIDLWQMSDLRNSDDHCTAWGKYLSENDRFAEDLWEKRKELEIERQRIRKINRHRLSLGNADSKAYGDIMIALDEKADKSRIYDAENDIIDTYAALRATQRTSQFFFMLNAKAQPAQIRQESYGQEDLSELAPKPRNLQDNPRRSEILSDRLSEMNLKSGSENSHFPNNDRIIRGKSMSTSTDKNSHTTSSRNNLPRQASSNSATSNRSRKSTSSKSGTKTSTHGIRRSNTVLERISEESPLASEFNRPSSSSQKFLLPLAKRDSGGLFVPSRYSFVATVEDDSEIINDSHSSWITASIADSKIEHENDDGDRSHGEDSDDEEPYVESPRQSPFWAGAQFVRHSFLRLLRAQSSPPPPLSANNSVRKSEKS